MRISKLGRGIVVSLALAAPIGLAMAEKGAVAKHPNLLAAQKLINQAIDKVTAAQKANEFDLGGHAAKAKDALSLAKDEIKQAAEQAEDNKKK